MHFEEAVLLLGRQLTLYCQSFASKPWTRAAAMMRCRHTYLELIDSFIMLGCLDVILGCLRDKIGNLPSLRL